MAEIDRLQGKAVPVIRMHDPANARTAVSWLREGGLDVFEITATVPGFEKLIADLLPNRGCSSAPGPSSTASRPLPPSTRAPVSSSRPASCPR